MDDWGIPCSVQACFMHFLQESPLPKKEQQSASYWGPQVDLLRRCSQAEKSRQTGLMPAASWMVFRTAQWSGHSPARGSSKQLQHMALSSACVAQAKDSGIHLEEMRGGTHRCQTAHSWHSSWGCGGREGCSEEPWGLPVIQVPPTHPPSFSPSCGGEFFSLQSLGLLAKTHMISKTETHMISKTEWERSWAGFRMII